MGSIIKQELKYYITFRLVSNPQRIAHREVITRSRRIGEHAISEIEEKMTNSFIDSGLLDKGEELFICNILPLPI